MFSRCLPILLTVAVAGAAPDGLEPAGAPASVSGVATHRLDELVRQRLDESNVPGASVLVMEDGKVVWAFSEGTATDGSPVTPSTPFGIGSISKGVTGVVTASLVADGILDLDTPVERILPALRQGGTPAGHREITVRHLVYHTSGLDPRGERLFVADSALERARAVWRRSPVREPGEGFEYLNTSYLILGLVLEEVAGRPFAELVEERVLAPLKGIDVAAFRSESPARAHQLWFGWPVHHEHPPRESLASGGLTMSAHELGLLVEALGRGGRVGGSTVLDAEVVRLATTPGVRIDDESSYAMGWYRRPIAGSPTLSHGGSTPGFSGFALHQEDPARTVVALTGGWGAIWGSQTPIWIAADIVRILDGEPVPERRGAVWSYLWLDLVVLVSLVLTVRSTLRLRSRPAELAELPSTAERWKKAAPVVAWNFGTALALAWFVPLWAEFSLRSFLAVPSDVTVLLLFGIASGIAFGIAELIALGSAARRARIPS